MKTIIHKAESRGHANHGWLDSYHTFSFAGYYDPDRVHFGALRVLNDDVVQPSMGFGTHPHDNMEIVTIPIEGALAHKDSTGRQETIHTNDVQIMSAGSGIQHSEFNASTDKLVNLLQIWVFPKERDIEPRYGQKTYKPEDRVNKWKTVVAPDDADALWINQDAYFSLTKLEKGKSLDYTIKQQGNGAYVFIIDGKATIEGNNLDKRDAIGISEAEKIKVSATEDAEILLIEVPMV